MKQFNEEKDFYTQNGYAGKKASKFKSGKELAVEIRQFVKKFKGWKFSVSSKWGMNADSIYVKLMKAPINIFSSDEEIKKYFKERGLKLYIEELDETVPVWDIEEKYWPELIEYKKDDFLKGNRVDLYLGGKGYRNDASILNEETQKVFEEIKTFIMDYHYDDSDGMIDYFDTNFYLTLQVGNWDKPCEIPSSLNESEFYTQNGYSGENISKYRGVTELNKEIRNFVKKFNGWKFVPKKTGRNSLYLYVMKAPINIFSSDENILNYLKNQGWVDYTINNHRVRREDVYEKNLWGDVLESFKKQVIEGGIIDYDDFRDSPNSFLNKEARNVLKEVDDFVLSYHFDDSDAQIDYFNTNFYYYMCLGLDSNNLLEMPETKNLTESEVFIENYYKKFRN